MALKNRTSVLCSCTLYEIKKKEGTLTGTLNQIYEEHQSGKKMAQNQKNMNIVQDKSDSGIYVVIIDFEAVLVVPYSLVVKCNIQDSCCFDMIKLQTVYNPSAVTEVSIF